jgi:hypothetical protein
MLDPYCSHDKQCPHEAIQSAVKEGAPVNPSEEYPGLEMEWKSRYLDRDNTREDPVNYYDRRTSVCECLYSKDTKDIETGEYEWDKMFKYTFGVVAKTEEHLFDFLTKKNQWTPEHQRFVRSIHPMARKICRHCREAYTDYIVLGRGPSDFADSIDELLHGEMSFRRAGFYSGGAFDSTRVRDDARSTNEYLSLLRAQEIAEETKYLIRHGSNGNYKPRFAYGDDLETLLEKAASISFAEPNRRPLGLNPERFMADCEKCQKEMPGREYGTKLCVDCESRMRSTEDRKPSGHKRPRTEQDVS